MKLPIKSSSAVPGWLQWLEHDTLKGCGLVLLFSTNLRRFWKHTRGRLWVCPELKNKIRTLGVNQAECLYRVTYLCFLRSNLCSFTVTHDVSNMNKYSWRFICILKSTRHRMEIILIRIASMLTNCEETASTVGMCFGITSAQHINMLYTITWICYMIWYSLATVCDWWWRVFSPLIPF